MVFAMCSVQVVRVQVMSKSGSTMYERSCVGSAVGLSVAVVVFSVTWVFVAYDGITGTGGSVAFVVCIVIEMSGVVLGEDVLCEMCICFAGGAVGGPGGE